MLLGGSKRRRRIAAQGNSAMAHYSCDDGKCADLRGVARTRGIPAAGTAPSGRGRGVPGRERDQALDTGRGGRGQPLLRGEAAPGDLAAPCDLRPGARLDGGQRERGRAPGRPRKAGGRSGPFRRDGGRRTGPSPAEAGVESEGDPRMDEDAGNRLDTREAAAYRSGEDTTNETQRTEVIQFITGRTLRQFFVEES